MLSRRERGHSKLIGESLLDLTKDLFYLTVGPRTEDDLADWGLGLVGSVLESRFLERCDGPTQDTQCFTSTCR